jgi:hypothetical protein
MKIPYGCQGHVYEILTLLTAYSGELEASEAKQRIGKALSEVLDDGDRKPEVNYREKWLHRLEAAVDRLKLAGFLERGWGFWRLTGGLEWPFPVLAADFDWLSKSVVAQGKISCPPMLRK